MNIMAKTYKMNCGTGNFKVKVNPVTIKVESNYFLISRRKECENFLRCLKSEIVLNNKKISMK